MKTDLLGYWLGGALSVVIGAAVVSGMDLSPAADMFSVGLTLLVSFMLTAFGGLLWMVGSTRLKSD